MVKYLLPAFCLLPLAALAAGEDVYKLRCSLCHEAGATNAPRIGDRSAWAPRIAKGRAALVRSSLQGVPNTAMLPKAGFPEVGDADIIAALDFMLAGFDVPEQAATPAAKPVPIATVRVPPRAGRVDDATLTARVAEALRETIATRDTVDLTQGTRIGGILVQARSGVVTLSGVVGDTKLIKQASDTARNVPGVDALVVRLVPADIFEHD